MGGACQQNNKKCQYRHALPPGFVLKKKKTGEEHMDKGPSLEELIEIERAKIGQGTPVTWETFSAWKVRKEQERAKKDSEAAKKRKVDIKKGAKMSGKEAFEYKPELFVDDANAADESVMGARVQSDDEDDEGASNAAATEAQQVGKDEKS